MKYGDVPDCISEWKNIRLNYKKGIYNIKLNCRWTVKYMPYGGAWEGETM